MKLIAMRKIVILIFLNVLIPLIHGDDDIECTSTDYPPSPTICMKDDELVYVNQTKNEEYLSIKYVNSIAPNAFQNLSIKIIVISNSRLRLQPKSFEGLRQVQSMHIRLALLEFEHNNTFAVLESLEYLTFSSCTFTFPKDGLFAGLPKLKHLTINNHKSFEMLPGMFTGLYKLERLALYENKIKTIKRNIFYPIKHMNALQLDWNKIDTIEPEAFYGISIGYLDLSGNRLTVIPIGAFDGASIDRLILYGNRIVQIEHRAFANSIIKELQYAGEYLTIDKQMSGLEESTVLNGTHD